MLPVARAMLESAAPVIELNGIAIRADSLAARKHHVVHIANALVGASGPKIHGSLLQAGFRMFKIEERQAQAVDASRGRDAHTVVESSASPWRFNGRRAKANLVRIPPSPRDGATE